MMPSPGTQVVTSLHRKLCIESVTTQKTATRRRKEPSQSRLCSFEIPSIFAMQHYFVWQNIIIKVRIRTRRTMKNAFFAFFLRKYFAISKKSSTFAPLFRRTRFWNRLEDKPAAQKCSESWKANRLYSSVGRALDL